jgi:hypothetical protein
MISGKLRLSTRDEREEERPRALLEFFKAILGKKRVLTPLPRCKDGVYDPHGDGRYCSVCNPIQVNGVSRMMRDIRNKKTDQRLVKPETVARPYRNEVAKGTAHARRILMGYKSEGKKHVQDLSQVVDFEIWKATEKYGNKMTPALAFTIARNQSTKLLAALASQPKTLSLDKELVNNEGEVTTLGDQLPTPKPGHTSLSKHIKMANPPVFDWKNTPGIEEMVRKWHGAKRKVADALLADSTVSVRDIPGVPKSTASRVRQVVLLEFTKLRQSTLAQQHAA